MTVSPSRWPLPRIIAWGITAAVIVAAVGPTYLRAFLPPEGAYTDFLQEWLSARNYLSGAPAYREIPLSIQEHLPQRSRADGSKRNIVFVDPATGAIIAEMRYNAHPPFAVLVAVPFALLDYSLAHLAWNLATYGLFLAAVVVVVRELRIPFAWPAVFPAIILLLGNPLLNQVYQGQLNCLLASLLTVAWVADRRGRPILAGVAVGLAGAVKLYPLYLLIYFFFTRRWVGLGSAIVTFLAANALAGALFGVETFRHYFADVLPAVAGQFEKSWINLSLHGFWLRLMETQPLVTCVGSAREPLLGRVLAWGAALVVTVFVARACNSARTRVDRDEAYALALVAMLLVSPITWSHYSILLLLPFGLAWMRIKTAYGMWVLGAIVGLLWLPPNFLAELWLGRNEVVSPGDIEHHALTTADHLGFVSIPHYALLCFFVLLLRLRGRSTSPGDADRQLADRKRANVDTGDHDRSE